MRLTILLVFVILAAAQTKLPAPANVKVDFEKHIQPLLAEKCYSCHGGEVQQAGLRLDARQPALRGGDYGPVIIPGNSAKSKLIRRLVDGDGGLRMPPTGPLSNEEIDLFRAWIDQGVDWHIQVPDEAPAKPVDPKLVTFIDAVRSAPTNIVDEMLASDPELLKAKDPSGSTPLHHAAAFGSYETVKLLLDKGADPNALNRRKSTPLFWAVSNERKFRLLMEHGADVRVRNAEGRTLVFQAALLGDGTPLLRLLLERGANPDGKTVNGMTPLMAAAGHARVEAMRRLLERGANPSAETSGGGTALMAAAATGSQEAVRILLEAGANPNAKTKRNQTALAYAATAGIEQTVKLLLDKGAKVDVQDDRGYTALLYAAGSDAFSVGVVKLLLDKGANPELKGDGETARMLAAKRGNTEVARLLGASVKEPSTLSLSKISTERSVTDSVSTALALLEKQSYNFIRIGGCNSCHGQDLPSAAVGLAKSRGMLAPKSIPQLPLKMTPLSPDRLIELPILNFGSFVTGPAWILFNMGMNGVTRNQFTDAAVRHIKDLQTPEGHWSTIENRRPPMSAGAYEAAALAIYGLKHYGPPAEKTDTDNAIARAASWLGNAKPSRTQERAFHLLGLAWSNANPAVVRAAAKALAASQRADGSWSQLPTMESDAYATGQALYALQVGGGMPVTDPVYEKGVRYLLTTQAKDGSWHVKSRSIWVQPYFESGFPYGHDQWISAAGTAWATMALAASVEPERTARK